MKFKILSILILGFLLLGSTALAAEFIKPSNESGSINLPASEPHRNLYVAGSNLAINSPITGDLVAAGGMVDVTGNVEDDVIAAGGNLTINGRVGGSLRAAGGSLTLRGPVAEDALIAGGNIYVADTGTVGGDLVAAGGNIDIQSPIAGKAKLYGETININSSIAGELTVSASTSLSFGPNARVSGKIVYYGNSDPKISEGAQVSNIEKHPLERRGVNFKKFVGIGSIVNLLAWIAAGLLLMYLMKRELHTATDNMRSEPWANLGIGLISLILVPIAFVILLISVIGYYIALLLIVLYILALMLSGIVGAVFLGRWILGYMDKNAFTIDWRTVLVGVLAFAVLSWIPFIGWLITFLLAMMAFGSILRMAKWQMRR